MAWEHAYHFGTISCVRKSGEKKEFEVRVDPLSDSAGRVWFYYAKPLPVEEQDEQEYFASVKEVGPNLLQTEGLKNGLQRYQGYGITRTLIPLIAKALSVQIRSSRRRDGDTELRTDDATRIWERMLRDGSASYDRTEDRFYCPPR
jgi:hypothetical protein